MPIVITDKKYKRVKAVKFDIGNGNYVVTNETIRPTDLMLDLETLGTVANTVVLSIGLVAFNSLEGTLYNQNLFHLNIPEQVRAGRYMDWSTICWWMEQAEGNYPAVARAFFATDRSPVGTALARMVGYYKRLMLDNEGRELSVWCKPASFDFPIIRSLCDMCGYETPWHYRSEKCLRTKMDGFRIPPEIRNTWKAELVSHDPIDDCILQATELCYMRAYRAGRSPRLAEA